MLLVEPKGPASAKRGDQPSRQRAKRVPRLAVLVQIPTPSRAEGGEARGAPVTSGSCLTLFAKSLHPAAPLREQLRSEAEEGGAQHNPGPLLLRGTGTRTTAPPGHPSHFRPVFRQWEIAYPNPNAAPVICQSPCSRLPGNRS